MLRVSKRLHRARFSPTAEAEAALSTPTLTGDAAAVVEAGPGEMKENLTKVELQTGRPPAASLVSPTAEAEQDAIDLGAAVLPVLAKRYAGLTVVATGAVVIGWLLGRRRSRG
jgi:uncharacterized protein